jgi:hypothetical protein
MVKAALAGQRGSSRSVGPLAGVLLGCVISGCTVITTPGGAAPHDAPSVPVLDRVAPLFWDAESGRRTGGEARLFELDDADRKSTLSAWYQLSYVPGSDRLRVYEGSPRTDRGPSSDIAKSQRTAWQVAGLLLNRDRAGGELPGWARPRTGSTDGTSAGLLYTLTDLDLLTPGRLAASLRVAATGTIGSDGVVTAVRLVDAKLAAARLAGSDVVFSPDFPDGSGHVTTIPSHRGERSSTRTIGDWLNTGGYEDAGRAAAQHPGEAALVVVDDVRQVLAWLCGRTMQAVTCALAHTAAAVPAPAAHPSQRPVEAHVSLTASPR